MLWVEPGALAYKRWGAAMMAASVGYEAGASIEIAPGLRLAQIAFDTFDPIHYVHSHAGIANGYNPSFSPRR
jgi:hypothetical protein